VIRRLGGHLGTSVSALVDGQLDPETTERAWEHVLSCATCRGQVEREAWVKRRLSMMCGNEPSADLLGSLHGLAGAESAPTWAGLEAWAEVDRLEAAGRGRRRAGFALVGAGGMSAAVLGIAALGSFGFGGGAPAGPPPASITGSTPSSSPITAVLPAVAHVRGRLPRVHVPAGSDDARTVDALAHH
jgi:hypothetical protein